MAPTRYLITTDPQGYRPGSDFNDTLPAEDIEKAAISRVVVGHDAYIHSLTVHYTGITKCTVQRGGTAGRVDEVVLEADEWITKIEGNITPNLITLLKFKSNKGKTWGPFGRGGGSSIVFDPANKAPSDLASRMGLLYFIGNSDGSYICLLQATFAEYPGRGQPPKIVKFEKHIDAEPTTQATCLLSTFTKQLMSPIVTLRIGLDKTEFRAYEDILCKLPFFRAALQGGFKEATEKIITMPEDELVTVSALVEFLYTGRYTYTYKPATTENTDKSEETPICDVTQGSFHVSVYAIASKYDCQVLVEGAVANFTYVLKELKGIDVVRLLKVAYAKGLLLSELEIDGGLHGFMHGLPKLIGGLYKTHREEMECIVSEYPALASDFLRLVTADSAG